MALIQYLAQSPQSVAVVVALPITETETTAALAVAVVRWAEAWVLLELGPLIKVSMALQPRLQEALMLAVAVVAEWQPLRVVLVETVLHLRLLDPV
jgi:hypothetical protein